MYYFPKLYKGVLLKRYKRFFADIKTQDNTIITAHNPNTGSMRSLIDNKLDPLNLECMYSISDNTNRKLRYTLEAIKVCNEWIISNTTRVNSIVEDAILSGDIKNIEPIFSLKREYTYRDSRIDFFINSNVKTLLEVKSVTYFDAKTAYFPDSVTTRGRKHLDTLIQSLSDGYRAIMLYVCMIRRSNFSPATHIDPSYSEKYYESIDAGVDMIPVYCDFSIDAQTAKISDYYI